MEIQQLKSIIEAAIMASGEPVSADRLRDLFDENERPSKADIQAALEALTQDCEIRGIELKQVASGYCFQSKAEFAGWVKRLWPDKHPRYSRALMETLAIIAYRQPATRGEIEEIRGVAVNSNIIKTLLDHEWIEVVGQREVPGRPSLFGTTKHFLDHFSLKSIDELPALAEPQNIEELAKQLEGQISTEGEAESETESESQPEAESTEQSSS